MFEVVVRPGECVITQGDVGDNFYVCESGGFTVFKDGKAVGQITTPGAAFGELARGRVDDALDRAQRLAANFAPE